uniref:Uncharacterized protein n=1 Tax=Romanomermis culicivorax TaxID=13658 RepID=A0A915JM02_ROMCU
MAIILQVVHDTDWLGENAMSLLRTPISNFYSSNTQESRYI